MMLTNFTLDEFTCKCGCGTNNISVALVGKLQIARTNAGVPFIVTSACRCEKHNKDVGGVKNSFHTQGLACDIKFKDNVQLFKIVKGLLEADFKRILIYPKKSFIHVDIGKDAPQDIIKIMEQV